MIFGDVIAAGVMGTASFLQADAKGWRLFLACLGLVMLGSLGVTIMSDQVATEAFAKALANPEQARSIFLASQYDLRLFALGLVVVAGIVMTIGVAAGAVLGRWLTPGKTGGATFVGGYLLINLIYFSFVAGR